MTIEKLDYYNDFLEKQRGWISKWPEKCVFIYSGGLDSTVTQAMIMEERGTEIFPLFVDRGQTNVQFERQAAVFYTAFFKERYGSLYHDLFEIKVSVPAMELKDNLKGYAAEHGYPLRNTILQMMGVQYAVSLLEAGQTIKSILCAQVADDPFPHSSLAALRANTINVCDSLGEWDWQITSPNIDPQLNEAIVGKVEMIKWADQHDIPLGKTRSCYSAGEQACGECLTCRRRKEAFVSAGVNDDTDY